MLIAPKTLYVVATPIGNLGDISARARQILSSVNLIAAEDTRRGRTLLSALGLPIPQLIAFHEHNEATQSDVLVERILAGETAALISDAGTPLISDPGFKLIRKAQDSGISVCAIPGPSALTAALSVCGIATNRFAFEGFLPSRPAARKRYLSQLSEEPRTLVFYVAPHRLIAVISDCLDIFGPDREAALVRELTKIHESTTRTSLQSLQTILATGSEPARGECVLVVAGVKQRSSPFEVDELLKALLNEGIRPTTAANIARHLTNQPRRTLYQRAVLLAKNTQPN